MSETAVIYKSYYGTTKRYAAWITEELGASLLDASKIKPAQLGSYKTVIYGGGLYAGGIAGVSLVTKNPCDSLVVFTVGLATPAITDYTAIMKKAFSDDDLARIKVFHLQGGIDYGRLSLVHKAMMAMKKKEVENTPLAERTSDDLLLLETYGSRVDFTEKDAIKPLVDYVYSLQ